MTVIRTHKNKKARQVGRGGKRGKTSGKGTKGQNARAGRKFRPALRDIIKKLPKLRGYRFHSTQKKPAVVNVGELEVLSITEITPKGLVEAGAVNMKNGKVPEVKILGGGKISRIVTVSGCTVSASAGKKIAAAGGKVNK